jgi:putative FmdB family regulatory protein
MPIFEFACRRCGHRFETLVLDGRKSTCPECDSVDLEKLCSTFGARTAGAGQHGPSPSPFT